MAKKFTPSHWGKLLLSLFFLSGTAVICTALYSDEAEAAIIFEQSDYGAESTITGGGWGGTLGQTGVSVSTTSVKKIMMRIKSSNPASAFNADFQYNSVTSGEFRFIPSGEEWRVGYGTYNGTYGHRYDSVSGLYEVWITNPTASLIDLDAGTYSVGWTSGIVGPEDKIYGSAHSTIPGHTFGNLSHLADPEAATSYIPGLDDIFLVLCDTYDCTYELDPVLVNSDISTTTTWGGSVYVISGNITLLASSTLTIQPGTVIKFDTATSSSLTIEGTLNALGERDDSSSSWIPVTFTSIEDDNIGNPPDTDEDGSSTPPVAGDWGGITVNTGGSVNLYGSIIRYAGDGSGAGVYNNGGDVLVASSSVVQNDSYGVYNDSGTTTIYSTDLAFQDYGLYVNGGSASITATSTIHDNDLYGIYNDIGSEIYAQHNYWATSTGPSSAYGSAVHGDVDYTSYIPYIHYIQPDCPLSTCGSVVAGELLYHASTTYTSELSDAVDTWNDADRVELIATSSIAATLSILNVEESDVVWKGGWSKTVDPDESDLLLLNEYYLDSDNHDERQHTITHELGHALGLRHSYTGNIMFYNQTDQTLLGQQDLRDYYYLWP